ncbi:MAG TPA: calcium/proton exchanger [Gemmatimonadaceae bacterium]|nr:calcium/proton exchanger [Gemmatimonadaceae bacterium]
MSAGAPRKLRPIWLLLAAVPAAAIAHWAGAPDLAVFALSAIAILPLSALLGDATEHLAARVGPVAGGVVNASLGNLAELIIGVLALRAGMVDLVKASITGSILGNLLLVLGASQLAGGLRHRVQRFSRHLAGMNVSLLVVAVVGLVVPALFHAAHPDPGQRLTQKMSEFVAALLIVGYALSLLYSMGTHRALFAEGEEAEGAAGPAWTLRRTVGMLVGVSAALAWMSEMLVGATQGAVAAAGLSEFFVGVVVVPIIGNAAEHSTAVLMAARNRMDLALGIALGSTVQVALLVAPVLVFSGVLMGQRMDLAFSTFEVASVALAVWIASVVVQDGESNWLEGSFLLIVYALLGVAFFFF